MRRTIEIDESDFTKILDALAWAERHFTDRDRMNADIHLSVEPRWSPITSVVISARERAQRIYREFCESTGVDG